MPFEIRRRGLHYEVVNTVTGKVHAKHTTRDKAVRQVRLLRAVDHGFKPTGTPSKYPVRRGES